MENLNSMGSIYESMGGWRSITHLPADGIYTQEIGLKVHVQPQDDKFHGHVVGV